MTRRDKEIRVNDKDLTAIKAARNAIDTTLPLGLVARMGAEKLMKETDGGVSF